MLHENKNSFGLKKDSILGGKDLNYSVSLRRCTIQNCFGRVPAVVLCPRAVVIYGSFVNTIFY